MDRATDEVMSESERHSPSESEKAPEQEPATPAGYSAPPVTEQPAERAQEELATPAGQSVPLAERLQGEPGIHRGAGRRVQAFKDEERHAGLG
jgi:hypothetical protein